MVCPKCHRANPDEDTYCGGCGAALSVEAAALRVPGHAAALWREGAILVAGVAAVIVGFLVAWWVLVQVRSPKAVVEAFMAADRAGRYTDQRDMVTSGPTSAFALTVFQGFRRQMSYSLFDGAKVGDTNVDGLSANVDVSINPPKASAVTGHSPGSMVITFRLERVDGSWKIDAATTAANAAGTLAVLGYQQSLLQLNGKLPIPLPNVPLSAGASGAAGSSPAPGASGTRP